ncbi:MAG: hypothetical protein KGZ83_00060 [Sulfuricella sp.]|nr:hypothetical protein [Sulfuricella sp.]
MKKDRRVSRCFRQFVFSMSTCLMLLSNAPATGETWKALGGCQDTDMVVENSHLISRSCTIYTFDNISIQQPVGVSSVSGMLLGTSALIQCDDGSPGVIQINVAQNFPGLEAGGGVVDENNKFLVEVGADAFNSCTYKMTGEVKYIPTFDMGDSSPVNPPTDGDSDPGAPDACDCSE